MIPFPPSFVRGVSRLCRVGVSLIFCLSSRVVIFRDIIGRIPFHARGGKNGKQCCGLLSLFGVFFLFSVSNMFHTQPMYTDVEVWHDHEDEEAGNNCFLAAWIYVVTFAVRGAAVRF